MADHPHNSDHESEHNQGDGVERLKLPGKGISVSKLRRSIEESRRRLRPFREKRMEVLRQYVGFHYSEDGAEDIVPVNFIELATNIILRSLVADNPRTMMTSRHDELKPQSLAMQLATNHWIKKDDLQVTLENLARDAIFSVGIVKKGITRDGFIEIDDEQIETTKPFVDVVDLDDFVIDMKARNMSEVSFIGSRHRASSTELRTSPLYDQEKIKAVSESLFNQDENTNEDGDTRPHTLSQGQSANDAFEFQEFTEVWDIYLPQTGEVIFLLGGSFHEIGRVIWDGPEEGPYDMLSFNTVPGNIMPLSPAALMMDMHELGNNLYRKLGRQAMRQKTIGIIDGRATDDGERVQKADDGEIIRGDTASVNELRFGGADPQNLAMFLQNFQLFSKFQGNLDVLGGLAPQSETVGQERILGAAASKRITAMQDKLISFTEKIVRDIAFYLWTDPLIDMPLNERLPGFDINIPVSFNAAERKGDFLDYNITIDVFSMQKESPSSKVQAIMGIVQNFFLPLLPNMQAEGLTMDFEEITKILSSYTNLPELADIIVTTTGEDFDETEKLGPIGQPPSSSPFKLTQTIRTNRSGTTERGIANAMIQQLMGSKVQQSEAPSFGGAG